MPDPTGRPKYFTVDGANATLPLVRRIVGDLSELAHQMIERRHRLSLLLRDAEATENDSQDNENESAQLERLLDCDDQQLKEFIAELRALGVKPTTGPEGLVDFPALVEGREICLCWKLGEPEVLYWHEKDAKFRSRKRLNLLDDLVPETVDVQGKKTGDLQSRRHALK